MESEEVRRSFTSRGFCTFSPWNEVVDLYTIGQINLGNNINSSLEIVSSLNLFNLGINQYVFSFNNCIEKYNPKVYIGAVQNVAIQWDLDSQDPEKVDPEWVTAGDEKSGSWPQDLIYFNVFYHVLNVII